MATPKAGRRGDVDPDAAGEFGAIPPANGDLYDEPGGSMSGPSRWATKYGHPLDETVSSLQKAIRRGQVKAALYWGHEMYVTYPAYFWRRMLIIASEDCSADPMVPVMIGQLAWSAWFASKEFMKGRTSEVIEIQAILLLARSKKSRETSDAG